MAIIHCPECGQEISDKAEKCVHCGVSLRMCSECKTIFPADRKECPNCGCISARQPKENAEEEEVSLTATKKERVSVLEKWRSAYPMGAAITVITNLLCFGCLITIAVLLFVFHKNVLENYKEDSTDGLTLLLSYAEDVKTAETFRTVIIVLFCSSSFIMATQCIFNNFVGSDWIRKKKIDVFSELERWGIFSGELKQKEETPAEMYWLAVFPNHKALYIAIVVIEEILNLVLSICLTMWGYDYAIHKMNAVMFGQVFNIGWLKPIIMVVLYVLTFVVKLYFDELVAKHYLKKWYKIKKMKENVVS